MEVDTTPVHVIGGYLGSGKTTLVNRLLREADGRRIAVLVNDFGDVDIDGALIESVDDDVVSLSNGCICCSLADGLVVAFAAVRERRNVLDHVVVEASGVADPRTIVRYGHAAGLAVGPLVVVADVATVQQRAGDRYVGDTVLRQLATADLCLLNKVDLVDADQLDRVRTWIAGVAADAAVIVDTDDAVGWETIDGATSVRAVMSTLGVEHDDAHRSRTFRYDVPLDRAALVRAVDELPEHVVRVKGIVHLADDETHAHAIHRAGGDVEISQLRALPPAVSRIVVIATDEGVVPDLL